MVYNNSNTFGVLEYHRGYGATAARLTPYQKVGSSNLSALNAKL